MGNTIRKAICIHSSGQGVVVAFGLQLGQDTSPVVTGDGNLAHDSHEQVEMSLLVPDSTVRHLEELVLVPFVAWGGYWRYQSVVDKGMQNWKAGA